jgi:hypothetical protein
MHRFAFLLLLLLAGCQRGPSELDFMDLLVADLPSFGREAPEVAIQKHRRLWEMAHAIEEKKGFQRVNANRTIGMLSLRLYALSLHKGDPSAAEVYRQESLKRLIAGEVIPAGWPAKEQEELWEKTLQQVFEMENPSWTIQKDRPNQAAQTTPGLRPSVSDL